MAKKTVVRKQRRDNIDAAKFVEVYRPMAEQGKSAKEIGAALGRDEKFVYVKAATLRKAIRKQCEARKLSEEQLALALKCVPELHAKGRNVLTILGLELNTNE